MELLSKSIIVGLSIVCLLKVSLCHNIVKRSDDPNALATTVQELAARLSSLEAKQNTDDQRLSKCIKIFPFRFTCT